MMSEEDKGIIIPVNEDSIKASSAVVGGLAGFAFGGPLFAVIFAAATNYIASQDNEVSEVTLGVGQVSLQTWNFILKLNNKYDLTGAASDVAGQAVDKIKEKDEKGVISKIEDVAVTAVKTAGDLNEEYDLKTKAANVIGSAGQLSNKAIEKGIELNEEYEITSKVGSKVKDAASTAAEKARARSQA